MFLRLWFSWLEVHWKGRGGPWGPGCRGSVLGSLSFQWSRSAEGKNKASDKGRRMCGPYRRDLTPHLEANFMEERMQVVEQPAAIKDERRLQHLLVDLFIIQFLWWKNRAMTPK